MEFRDLLVAAEDLLFEEDESTSWVRPNPDILILAHPHNSCSVRLSENGQGSLDVAGHELAAVEEAAQNLASMIVGL